jgi:hypothetical protein
MTGIAEFEARISEALRIPPDEVASVARCQRAAGLQPAPECLMGSEVTAFDVARLLVGVMVMRIEGAATSAAALTADIGRLTSLRHGANLYLDSDFILPEDFIGAVAEILAALGDGRRRERAQNWIPQIGIARGAGRMAGWVEVRTGGDAWEDFDYAASAQDTQAILDTAPVVRRVEVRTAALLPIAQALAPPQPAARAAQA